jgi:hypothetical protein
LNIKAFCPLQELPSSTSRRQSGHEYGHQKKELIGQLYRKGQLYTQETRKVFDHDWPTLATGVAIPHGLYDMTDNVGYIQIDIRHDTSELACDSIRY